MVMQVLSELKATFFKALIIVSTLVVHGDKRENVHTFDKFFEIYTNIDATHACVNVIDSVK